MARKKVDGQCRLCGINGRLSFEHVPPQAAFNDKRVVKARMGEWFSDAKWSGKGEYQQGGAGDYTLCVTCNNDTGTWYGAEYVEWVRRAFEMLDRVPGGRLAPAGLVPVTFSGVRPLRFLKQAVTMIFSANGPGFAEKNEELVRFVLNREARHLPALYDVYLTLVRGQHARKVGVGGMLRFDSQDHVLLSEVAHPPFRIVLTIDSPPLKDHGRISHFGACGIDDEADVTLLLSTGEIYSPYPSDFRGGASFR
jgi:hypothetical protein